MKKEWPKWIELRYFNNVNGGIMGYLGSASNPSMLFENINRLDIKNPQDISFMHVNQEQQSKESIQQFFDWMEKKKEEIAKNEARKKADKKSKENDY
ncbi:hypothetical protein [Niallia sp. 03190]|uniref:hypothetical protein n=1 Tax=Niallia sp. 03190 TaxID=3458061 RepID=UPI0040449C6C